MASKQGEFLLSKFSRAYGQPGDSFITQGCQAGLLQSTGGVLGHPGTPLAKSGLDLGYGARYGKSRRSGRGLPGSNPLRFIRASLAKLPKRLAADGGPICLRMARADDEATILAWQRQPSTRRFSRIPRVPSNEEHHHWFNSRIRSESSLLTIIEHASAPGGLLRLDLVDSEPSATAFEISILVSAELRRLGLAKQALELAREWIPDAEFIAEVFPENLPSQKLFTSAGYRRLESGLFHHLPVE